MPESKIPNSLTPAFLYLLGFIDPQQQTVFDPEKAAAVLDFVAAAKDGATLYYPEGLEGTTSGYHEFEVRADLPRILEYAYNPDIPSQLLSPSSLRTVSTVSVQGEKASTPTKWGFRPEQETPQVVRITEHEEITPDLFTGAYYEYNVDRAMLLATYKGARVFISVARQRDASGVGKKGAWLGASEDWDYLYSGEKGLTKTGLGWVDSYMYKAFSVTVFYETDTKAPRVRCGIFKWLNAGWSGMNMVQRGHIHSGLERYAKDFTRIIESTRLPASDELAKNFAAFRALPSEELKNTLRQYLASVQKEYAQSKALSMRIFAELVRSGRYLETMNREQMQAILVLEYLKQVLGRPSKLPPPT